MLHADLTWAVVDLAVAAAVFGIARLGMLLATLAFKSDGVAAYLVADLLGGGCSQYLSPVLHEEKVALARK